MSDLKKCIAFVIGINDYDNNPHLQNAEADARLVVGRLEKLRFEVYSLIGESATYDKYINEIEVFYDKLFDGNYYVALFYFAGHGFSANASDCLLLKDGADIQSHGGTPAKGKSIVIQDVCKRLRETNQINIIIADACRTIIQPGGATRGVALTKEFGNNTSIPYQTLIAYSTSLGCNASDESGYTKLLVEEMGQLNQPIEYTFKNVRKKLYKKIGDQLPWENSCLVDELCLNYGQNDKYFDRPYSESAYKYSLFQPNSDRIKDLICVISSTNNEDTQLKTEFSKNLKGLDKNSCFVIGRLVCNKASDNQNIKTLLGDIPFINVMNNAYDGSFLRGIFYELYFDENDEPRNEIYGDVELLTIIERLRSVIHNKEIEDFIKEAIIQYKKNFHYLIGIEDSLCAHVSYEDTNYCDGNGKQIIAVMKIEVNDEDILYKIHFSNEMFTYRELREAVLNYLKIPMQYLKMSSINWSDNMIFTRYYINNIEYDLKEYINNDTSTILTLPYVENLDDIAIEKMENNDNKVFISGSCMTDVGHENIENRSFPCVFEANIKENKYKQYQVDTDTLKFRIITDSFLQ